MTRPWDEALMVHDQAGLDALPVGSVVIDEDLDVMHKTWNYRDNTEHWSFLGSERSAAIYLPVRVIYVSGEDFVADAWDKALVGAAHFVGNVTDVPNPYRREAEGGAWV